MGGVLASIRATNTEAEFHLDKQMALNIQAQDKTTCRNVAIESKPAYDIFVFGGGGFQASSPRRPRHTELEAGDRR